MKNNKYCTIYLIRHGETDWNRVERLQGNLPIPLNSAGKKQARSIAQLLRGVKLSAIYSSEARRAVETAEIIAAKHKLIVNLSKYIKERSYGELVGKTENEYSGKIKNLLKKYFELTGTKKWWSYRPLEGHESLLNVEKRMLLFLREVAVANIGKNVAVITHGANIKILLAVLGWVPREDFYKIKVGNTGYIVVKSDGTDIRITKIIGISKN